MSILSLRPAAILVLMLAALPGCALDPYARDGVWRPSAANETNLRTMVADPRDLQQGVGEPGANGELAAAAVRRLMEDRVRPLPSISTGGVGGGSN
jgi:type IV pilus biogenesis protein CpaD/CtpE